MLSNEDIIWGFRYCLGRNPSEDELLNEYKEMDDYRILREYLMRQPEYISRVRSQISSSDGNIDPIENYDRSTVVFVHIQKCAGTTVTHALEACFPSNRQCPERFNHLHLHSPSQLSNYDVYSGHFDLFSLKYIPRKRKFVFCIFREPAERLISFYRFVRAHPKSPSLIGDPLFALAETLSIEDYYSHEVIRNSRIVNNHYRAVLSGSISPIASAEPSYRGTLDGAIEALKGLNGIGITARLTESLSVIFRDAGLGKPHKFSDFMRSGEMHIVDNDVRAIEPIQKSERLQHILFELIEDDLEIYREAVSEFERRGTLNDNCPKE